MLKIAFVAVTLIGITTTALASDATFDQRHLAPISSASPQAKHEVPRPMCSCEHHAAAAK